MRNQQILVFVSLPLMVGLLACTNAAPPAGDQAAAAAEASGNCSFDSPAPGTSLDVVITNGRVMDPECEFDGVRRHEHWRVV